MLEVVAIADDAERGLVLTLVDDVWLFMLAEVTVEVAELNAEVGRFVADAEVSGLLCTGVDPEGCAEVVQGALV